MIPYEKFCENCAAIQARIARACEKSGRVPAEIKIVPVTKNHSIEAVRYAAQFGFAAVGENRLQEAEKKMREQASEPPARQLAAKIRWELIGHLQRNKARRAVELFDRIQSVDSVALVQKLETICAELSRKNFPILLQANAGSDPAKFGSADFDSLRKVAETAFAGTFLRVEGLMCVAPLDDDSLETAASTFETLHRWRDKLETEFGQKLPELSMGMSHDLEAAIAAGTTLVRIGTALFGERDYGIPSA